MSEPENPVPRLLDAYQAAVLAKDVDAFVALYDEDAAIFDAWAAWSHRGRAAWRAAVAGWFGALGAGRVTVEFTDLRSELAPGLAVVHAFVRYAELDAAGTRLRSMDNRYSAVMRERGGAWRIVHEHTSAPIAGDSMQALLQRAGP
jgi:uncharacterized protein (TIGR02246 family)